MEKDYVYVKKSHRLSNPQSPDYINQSKYFRMMMDVHGLQHDPMAPFDVPSLYNCFFIANKGKSMIFCLNNGDVIAKPEKTKNDLLTFGNHDRSSKLTKF